MMVDIGKTTLKVRLAKEPWQQTLYVEYSVALKRLFLEKGKAHVKA